MSDYLPEHPVKFDEMLRDLGRVQTKENLRDFTLIYLMDMSYSRKDLMQAIYQVEKAKGWR